MGKQTGQKSCQPGQLSGQMPAFFSLSPPAASQALPERQTAIMAPAGEGNGMQTAALTKADLLELKEDLKTHLASLIDQKLDPLTKQISSLSSTLSEVTNTANAAFEESERNRGLIKEIKATEKLLKDRIAWLEQRARAMNLKLRGVPERQEINNALLQNILTWITSQLNLEGNLSPTITSAYRVGPASLACPNFPRDIILRFLYTTERDALLQFARKNGALFYLGNKVIVLLDLPQEILMKRKSLKVIMDQLKAKNIRFRWTVSSDVVVVKDGAQLRTFHRVIPF